MNEKFIFLMEKFFERSLSDSEEKEFNSILENNPQLKIEFEDQKKIKEVLNKMKIKSPSTEVWDSYWLGVYRKLERGIAWIAISAGIIVLLAFGIYQAIESFLQNTTTPIIVKWGITLFLVGLFILLISLLREKFYIYKRDKYKEIQR